MTELRHLKVYDPEIGYLAVWACLTCAKVVPPSRVSKKLRPTAAS